MSSEVLHGRSPHNSVWPFWLSINDWEMRFWGSFFNDFCSNFYFWNNVNWYWFQCSRQSWMDSNYESLYRLTQSSCKNGTFWMISKLCDIWRLETWGLIYPLKNNNEFDHPIDDFIFHLNNGNISFVSLDNFDFRTWKYGMTFKVWLQPSSDQVHLRRTDSDAPGHLQRLCSCCLSLHRKGHCQAFDPWSIRMPGERHRSNLSMQKSHLWQWK